MYSKTFFLGKIDDRVNPQTRNPETTALEFVTHHRTLSTAPHRNQDSCLLPFLNFKPIRILAIQINHLIAQPGLLDRLFEIRERGEEDVVVAALTISIIYLPISPFYPPLPHKPLNRQTKREAALTHNAPESPHQRQSAARA